MRIYKLMQREWGRRSVSVIGVFSDVQKITTDDMDAYTVRGNGNRQKEGGQKYGSVKKMRGWWHCGR